MSILPGLKSLIEIREIIPDDWAIVLHMAEVFGNCSCDCLMQFLRYYCLPQSDFKVRRGKRRVHRRQCRFYEMYGRSERLCSNGLELLSGELFRE